MRVSSTAPRRFGRYQLEERLGQGGMAEVWRARAVGLRGFEKVVCIKRLLPAVQEDVSLVRMFVREAKLAALLDHPNVAHVFELGEEDGEFFIAMEFVRGVDLLTLQRAAAARGMRLPPAAAAYIAREASRALAYAHDLTDDVGRPTPIIHRDVSPQNLMLGAAGTVKLVDFGIAKALDEAGERTRTGVIKGKLAYLAPEQLEGQRASIKTDIFAMGIVLHEMLAGKRLFRGSNDAETVFRLKSLPIPTPSSIARTVPAALDAIAMRALDRDPARRYARMAEMTRDLERACAGMDFDAGALRSLLEDLVPTGVKVPASEPRYVPAIVEPAEEQGTQELTEDPPTAIIGTGRPQRSLGDSAVDSREARPRDSFGEPSSAVMRPRSNLLETATQLKQPEGTMRVAPLASEAQTEMKRAPVSEALTEMKRAPVSEAQTEMKRAPVSEAQTEMKRAPASEALTKMKLASRSTAQTELDSTIGSDAPTRVPWPSITDAPTRLTPPPLVTSAPLATSIPTASSRRVPVVAVVLGAFALVVMLAAIGVWVFGGRS